MNKLLVQSYSNWMNLNRLYDYEKKRIMFKIKLFIIFVKIVKSSNFSPGRKKCLKSGSFSPGGKKCLGHFSPRGKFW